MHGGLVPFDTNTRRWICMIGCVPLDRCATHDRLFRISLKCYYMAVPDVTVFLSSTPVDGMMFRCSESYEQR